MKKILKKIIEALGAFLGILIMIMLGICLIFMLPFDYIRYRRSPYYKKEHKKYRFFAGSGNEFELYNEILKNDLPIRFIENPSDSSLQCGWFVFNDILIISNVFSFEFDPESETWNYCCEDEEEKRVVMALDEYIDMEIQDANKFAEKTICNQAVVLINADEIDNADAAKSEPSFLIYNDDREKVLRDFCDIYKH